MSRRPPVFWLPCRIPPTSPSDATVNAKNDATVLCSASCSISAAPLSRSLPAARAQSRLAKIDSMWGVVYAAWVVSEIAILIFTRARTRTAGYRHHDRGSLFLLWPVITASISLGMWYGRLHPPDLFRDESQARL